MFFVFVKSCFLFVSGKDIENRENVQFCLFYLLELGWKLFFNGNPQNPQRGDIGDFGDITSPQGEGAFLAFFIGAVCDSFY